MAARRLGRRERIQDTVFIVLGVMSMAFLFLFLLQVILFSNHSHERFWDFPEMLRNPFFIAAILALLAYGHYLLEKWLERRFPSTLPITFNSEHRKRHPKPEPQNLPQVTGIFENAPQLFLAKGWHVVFFGERRSASSMFGSGRLSYRR